MEASQLSFLASLTTTVAYAGYKGYGLCQKKYKSRVFGLLVSNSEGLQQVIDDLEIDTTKIQPIIVSESLKGYLEEEKYEIMERLKRTKSPYYPIYLFKHFNEYLRILKKSNKNTVYVIITESLKLLKDLKVKNEQISLLLPSTKYYIKLLDKVEDKYTDQTNREHLVHLHYPKFYFNNKQELVNTFSKLFVKNNEINNIV